MLRKFQAKLEKELESCKKCMVDNKLSLQLGKTETMLVGSKKKKGKVKQIQSHVIIKK